MNTLHLHRLSGWQQSSFYAMQMHTLLEYFAILFTNTRLPLALSFVQDTEAHHYQ